jgi:TPR repeat protein
MPRLPRVLRFAVALLMAVASPLCAGTALAARSGPEIKAQFDAGLAAYDAGNFPEAFRLWLDLQFEDVAAMRNAAVMLRKGQGTPRDPKKAEELFQRAAEAGLPTAQADLADMLLKGEAGPPDLQSALPLLEAAAAANHPVALGELYETGAPPLLAQNFEVARQLYTAAAGHGMTAAADRLRALPPAPAPISATQATQATIAPLPPASEP